MYFNCVQTGCQSACFGLFDTNTSLGQIFRNRIEHNHLAENNDNDKEKDDIDKEEDLSYLFKKSKVIEFFLLGLGV